MRHGGAGSPPHPPPWEEQITPRTFTLADFAGLPIREAGELIRHEPVEHAVIYTPGGKALFYAESRPGSPSRVTIPLWKAGLIRGNVFVHNHPGGESFSAEDIWILLRHGAREVHAYGPERSVRMVAGKNTRRFGYVDDVAGHTEVHAAYRRALELAASDLERAVHAGVLTDAEAWRAQTHRVVRKLSMRFGFAYLEV